MSCILTSVIIIMFIVCPYSKTHDTKICKSSALPCPLSLISLHKEVDIGQEGKNRRAKERGRGGGGGGGGAER